MGQFLEVVSFFRVVLLELLLIIIYRAVYILERFLTANLLCQVLMTTEYNVLYRVRRLSNVLVFLYFVRKW